MARKPTTPTIECPVCNGHGELADKAIDPQQVVYSVCWMCQGKEVVTQAEVDAYDKHIKSVLGEGWF